jgi:fluoroquinolone transport system permease protein
MWILALTQLPAAGVEWILPFAIFMDLSVFGLYFMAAILFLEKGEGVLEALATTPMSKGAYLFSKIASLTVLAVLTSVAVAAIVHGLRLNWPLLIAGVALNSWMMTLVGFILAARYNAINEFLLPSMIFMAPSQLPALDYFDIWQSWLLYLIPTQPTMLLIEAAFHPIAAWEVVYSIAYLAAASVFVTWLALRAFERFIVRGEGE